MVAMPLPESLHIGPALAAVSSTTTPRGAHALDPHVAFASLAEIASTFHQPLKPEIAALYARKAAANPRLLFTALLGRRFTHDRLLDPAAIAAWKAGLVPLLRARRLGALILQFPWAFRFTAENRAFLIELRRAFREFPLAAEFRHDSWLGEEARGTLIDYHLAFVNVDQPQSFRATPPTALLTSGLAVVRLHGRSGPAAGRYLYSLDELEDWLPRIRRLAGHASRTLVVTANPGPDQALVNALQLQEMLGAAPLLAPAPLIRRYPAELAAFRANRPVQTTFLRDDLPVRAVA
jgi:uncharacterized protein YecE (DUF72 family)